MSRNPFDDDNETGGSRFSEHSRFENSRQGWKSTDAGISGGDYSFRVCRNFLSWYQLTELVYWFLTVNALEVDTNWGTLYKAYPCPFRPFLPPVVMAFWLPAKMAKEYCIHLSLPLTLIEKKVKTATDILLLSLFLYTFPLFGAHASSGETYSPI